MDATVTQRERRKAGRCSCTQECLKCKCKNEKVTVNDIAVLFPDSKKALKVLEAYSTLFSWRELEILEVQAHFTNLKKHRESRAVRPPLTVRDIHAYLNPLHYKKYSGENAKYDGIRDFLKERPLKIGKVNVSIVQDE